MEARLLRQMLILSSVVCALLTVREIVTASPVTAVGLATALSVGLAVLPQRFRARLPWIGPFFFGSLSVLISKAALDLGGATGPALSLGFIPGFLAVLVLGPYWGWGICAAMLAGFAWLGTTTPLPTIVDSARFGDEVAMTVFAVGLGHTLIRSFLAYEMMIERRRTALLRLEERRLEMARVIYDDLEPAAAELVQAVPEPNADPAERGAFERALDNLTLALRRTKSLARKEPSEAAYFESSDPHIRSRTMRIWLRLGGLLMVFFTIRNASFGQPVSPPLFLIVVCLGFDFWLGRPSAVRKLEGIALALGVALTAPLLVHVQTYGRTPNMPALVLAPSAILFTALLSQGPATWLVTAFNWGFLAWVAVGRALTLSEIRLIGDLGVSFVVVTISLGAVVSLRSGYARTLLEQANSRGEALRQHRRLAGTLFHDANNHLQSIVLYSMDGNTSSESTRARSLSRRVERLIRLSKQFLVSRAEAPPVLTRLSVREAFALLEEAFGPQLRLKQQKLELVAGAELEMSVDADLFVESVLGNLVSNAVKFSPLGSTIQFSAEKRGGEVRVVLQDSGPGLPPEIFAAQSGEGALPTRRGTRGEEGQGFGLRLAHEHVERMGGRLEIRNAFNVGTECVVWLKTASDFIVA
jgi:signal transduction histidine kinase